MSGNTAIQPLDVSESESAPSSLHFTTPQDTVNMASSESYFPPADVVHSQIPVSAQVYLGGEPSHVPMPFQYDLEDIFSLTNNPCQSCGRYDPCSHFLPPSNSTGRLSMPVEHSAEPYQQWPGLPVDPNTQIFPPPNLSYVSNVSSTFSGNSHNGIYAGSHFTMASANDGTENTLHFPTYSDDANNLHYDSHCM